MTSLVRLLSFQCPVVFEQELTKKARNNSLSYAKLLICCLASQELGASHLDITKLLGISQSAVSRWVAKGKSLNREMEDVAGEIFG